MKKNIGLFIKGTAAAGLLCIFAACNDNVTEKKVTKVVDPLTKPKAAAKPPATYQDTLTINTSAAVFFHPDSLQLLQIKAITDSMVFVGSMHEFFYQMRNARIVIKKTWPALPIIESEKNRYLKFTRKDGPPVYVDLDTKYDAHGLIVFDGKQAPEQVDMTNIESIMGFYFSKK